MEADGKIYLSKGYTRRQIGDIYLELYGSFVANITWKDLWHCTPPAFLSPENFKKDKGCNYWFIPAVAALYAAIIKGSYLIPAVSLQTAGYVPAPWCHGNGW